jgi:hypothetical protein
LEGPIEPEHLTDQHMAKFLWAFFRVYKQGEVIRVHQLNVVMHTLRQALQLAMLSSRLPDALLYPHTTTLYTRFKIEARQLSGDVMPFRHGSLMYFCRQLKSERASNSRRSLLGSACPADIRRIFVS